MYRPPHQPYDSTKNAVAFLAILFIVMFVWQWLFPEPSSSSNSLPHTQIVSKQYNDNQHKNLPANTIANSTFTHSRTLKIETDRYIILLDEATGDITQLTLKKYHSDQQKKETVTLMNPKINYRAQSRLILADNGQFLLEKIPFVSNKDHYTLASDQDSLVVVLHKQSDDLQIQKILTFKKGSYLIEMRYIVLNRSQSPLHLIALYRLLHNGTPEPSYFFNKFYTGPVLYTQNKFSKIPFNDIANEKTSVPSIVHNGWLGISQHYFASVFLLNPVGHSSICKPSPCQLYVDNNRADRLYQVGFTVMLPIIGAGQSQQWSVNLFSGPEEYQDLVTVDPKLPLIKDYGIWHVFANPLFLMLKYIHQLIDNWGWSIIILVFLLRLILFPLNSASFKSMAKMRKMAPKMQSIKENYGKDRIKMQQEIMALYKKEKINPLGGCLPMLLQIPIFLGLYWVLFNSVELRGAPWLGWVTDLSQKDPYFVLPFLLAMTMFLQSHLNPPTGDPAQARLMKIMPIAFSVMFFFMPSGLVLYWLVNNILTITQQWLITRSIEKQG